MVKKLIPYRIYYPAKTIQIIARGGAQILEKNCDVIKIWIYRVIYMDEFQILLLADIYWRIYILKNQRPSHIIILTAIKRYNRKFRFTYFRNAMFFIRSNILKRQIGVCGIITIR